MRGLAYLFGVATTHHCPFLYLRKVRGAEVRIRSAPTPADGETLCTFSVAEYLRFNGEVRREMTLELEDDTRELCVGNMPASRGITGRLVSAGQSAIIRNVLHDDGREDMDIYWGMRSVEELGEHLATRNRIAAEFALTQRVARSDFRALERRIDALLLRFP